MRESPITVTGEVVHQHQPHLFDVRLPNGKITRGHFSKSMKRENTELKIGSKVVLEMTPFDFDGGRIASVAT